VTERNPRTKASLVAAVARSTIARRVLVAALAGVLIAVLAAACGDDGSPSAPATTSGPIDTTGATIIEVGYTGGSITGGGKRTATLGKAAVVKVTTDVDDELHLHGYDLTVDTRPGVVATIAFLADKPGVFEVELHEKGLRLFELEVK
jgi:hypothetical protein